MDERPRSDVSDKYLAMQQLKVSTQYQEQKFFFEIKLAIAKVAPYAVFVGKRISGSDMQKRLKFLQGWQSI